MTFADSLPARLEAAARRGHSITFVTGGETVDVAWSQLLEEAKGFAAALQSRGIGLGSHVALLGPTTRALVTAIEGVWLSGATVVVLPLPMRMGSLDEFILAFFLSGTEPTLPVYIWGQLRFAARLPAVLALGSLMIVASVLLLTTAEVLRRRAERRTQAALGH